MAQNRNRDELPLLGSEVEALKQQTTFESREKYKKENQ